MLTFCGLGCACGSRWIEKPQLFLWVENMRFLLCEHLNLLFSGKKYLHFVAMIWAKHRGAQPSWQGLTRWCLQSHERMFWKAREEELQKKFSSRGSSCAWLWAGLSLPLVPSVIQLPSPQRRRLAPAPWWGLPSWPRHGSLAWICWERCLKTHPVTSLAKAIHGTLN